MWEETRRAKSIQGGNLSLRPKGLEPVLDPALGHKISPSEKAYETKEGEKAQEATARGGSATRTTGNAAGANKVTDEKAGVRSVDDAT